MKLNTKRTVLVGMAFFLISAFWQAYDAIVPLILTNHFGLPQAASGAVMSIGGLPIEVGMAHAEIEVGAKFEHRYFEERGCGYIFMRQEDGSLWDDYLIYTIENERVASLTWHVPI